MPSPYFYRVSCLALLLLTSSCSQKPDINQFVLLPDEIRESSALLCLDNGHFLTLNDSGNSSELFEIDQGGRILQRTSLAVSNTDWEAITQSEHHIFIGDIGNNSGIREQTWLWQLDKPWQQMQVPRQILLQHPDYPSQPPQPYQHDLDAEALVYANGAVWLFSKSWHSGHTQVYQWSVGQPLRKTAAIAGLTGLVTDAAFSEADQLFVLVGYADMRKNPLQFIFSNNYQPFLALVDTDFNLLQQMPLQSTGQVEAVCVDKQQQVWLTQEESKAQPAMLWRLGTVASLRASSQALTGHASFARTD